MIVERDRKVAEELTKQLLAQNGTRIKKVILFGSRATGTAGRDSDFDILVVEAGVVPQREEARRLRKAISELSYPVDVWVMSEEEFEETKGVVGGLAYPANRHGIVLYENT